jgi:hypothetical protein
MVGRLRQPQTELAELDLAAGMARRQDDITTKPDGSGHVPDQPLGLVFQQACGSASTGATGRGNAHDRENQA